MKQVGRVQFSVGRSVTRNEQWRGTELAHAKMMEIIEEVERRWLASPQDTDCLRFACTDTLIAVTSFMKKLGLNPFAEDRLDELIWSFARANWGQSTPLLARARMHPGHLSPIDRLYQGAAQACVEMYTGAGLPVGEARKRTARLFQLKKVKGLGVETLAKLGSRLSGKNAKSDPTYDYYRMAKDFGHYELEYRGGAWPPTESQAENVAKAIIRLTIEQDKAPK
jgi:hypothetical protein